VNLAAIDIGSNGARMLINRVINRKKIPALKSVEYLRFPLRLGKDVFLLNRISDKKSEEFFKLVHSFKLLMELHQVKDYLAFATSALRQAENGHELAVNIRRKLGVNMEIIDGQQEAFYLDKVLRPTLEPQQSYLHIDVGGGSTELNFYVKGRKVSYASFEVGTVRYVHSKIFEERVEKMKVWIATQIQKHQAKEITAIGTGGNINKLSRILDRKAGKLITKVEAIEVRNHVDSLSISQRINEFKLNPDRADTIIPALNLYLSAMEASKANNIIAPNLGLKDGMMYALLERNYEHALTIIGED